MKNSIKVLCYLVCAQLFLICVQNVSAQSINSDNTDSILDKTTGTWNGSLMVETTELPLVFKILKSDVENFKVTLDSPLQGAYNVPLGEITNSSGELKIDAPALQASYIGKLINDSTINGTWNQAGNSFPLKLQKSDAK